MSRLKIETPDQAQLTVERLYKDLERHIIASPPGLCPVDMQLSILKVCHAQTCGKCTPCRVGLAQLQKLLDPFRRAQDGNDHPIDPKTGDYTDGYHE